MRLIAPALAAVVLACGGVARPAAGPPLSPPDLRYRLADGVGPPLFCGPPVVRVLPPQEAADQVAALRARDPSTFDAIVRHEHLDPAALTTDQDRAVLRQAEVLAALSLTQDGKVFDFDYVASRSGPHHVAGTIDAGGRITLTRDDPTTFPPRPGGCPV